MILNVRRLAKQFSVYAVGNILQSALSFLLLPVYMRHLVPEEYGVIAILFIVVNFASVTASAGVLNGLHRLYFGFDSDERRRLAGTCGIWYLCFGAVVALALVVFAEPIAHGLFGTSERAHATRLLGIYFFFRFLLNVPFDLLRLEERSVAYMTLSIVNFGLDFVLKVLFVIVAGRGVVGYLESGLAGAAVTLIATSIAVRKLVTPRVDFSCLRQMLRLGAPFIVTGLAFWSLHATDHLLLNYLLGAASVGLYAIGQKFALIFNVVLLTPVSLLLPAVLFSFAEKHGQRETKRMFAKLMDTLVVLGAFAYLAIVLGSKDLIVLFSYHLGANEEYASSTLLIPILTAVPFCYFLSTCATYTLVVAKRPEIDSLAFVIVAVLNMLLNGLLIPRWGTLGAAAATVIAFLAYFGLAYRWAQRQYHVPYDWRGVFLVLGATVVIGAVLWLFPIRNPIVGLLVRAPAGALLLAIALWLSPRPLSRDLKMSILRRAQKLFLRS